MGEAWFTGFADELARCLVDAESCAAACEKLLGAGQAHGELALQRQLVDVVVGPAAIARVLIDLIDHPPQLVLAATRLCRDASLAAVPRLQALADRVDVHEAIAALQACEHSCARLLDAA
jgi:hypothetical protein